jgi:flagellar protein FliO/FliZ
VEASSVQFITGLFNGSGNMILTMVFALGIVIVLILLAVWLLKLVSNVSGNVARGRNKRLAVLDTLAVDQKRQLLIIRRDDVEHLILVGGPQDIVVETGFAEPEDQSVAAPARRPLPSLGMRKATAEKSLPPAPPVAPASNAPAEEPGPRRPTRSLRHTGLLRPVTVQDPTVSVHNPDAADGSSADSVKEDGNDTASEGKALEHHDGDQANRN